MEQPSYKDRLRAIHSGEEKALWGTGNSLSVSEEGLYRKY